MAPIALKKTSPAAMREAMAVHGFDIRMTSLDSGRVLRRGAPVGLWSNSQLELQLSAEELSRVRKSLAGLGIAA